MRHPACLRRASGFSLLELLVALAIFAVMAGMAYGGLSSVLRAHAELGERGERLAALQFAITVLERDLRQTQPRPIRDRFGEQRAALMGGVQQLEVSTLSATSAQLRTRPSLQRIGYGVLERRFVRLAYPVLDRSPGTRPADQPLIEGVESFRLRYLDQNNRWLDTWPPAPGGVPAWEALPRAVEVQVEVQDLGRVRRLLLLPEPALAARNPAAPSPTPAPAP